MTTIIKTLLHFYFVIKHHKELSKWFTYTQLRKIYNDIIKSGYVQLQFKYTILSWKILQNKKRWFKSFDIHYLKLKTYLLERVFHDMLFEINNCKYFDNIIT